jgi:predicted lactoylglutathione lyase
MSANITLITLCVADVAKATRFYESLGFVKSKTASQNDVSFFRAGGLVLALWGREAQVEDANAGALWTGNGGIVVAQNVASEREVDAVMAKAERAGARILKPASKTFWVAITAISPIQTAISGKSPIIRIGNWTKKARLSCRNDWEPNAGPSLCLWHAESRERAPDGPPLARRRKAHRQGQHPRLSL